MLWFVRVCDIVIHVQRRSHSCWPLSTPRFRHPGFKGERGNYHIQRYLSFIQHKGCCAFISNDIESTDLESLKLILLDQKQNQPPGCRLVYGFYVGWMRGILLCNDFFSLCSKLTTSILVYDQGDPLVTDEPVEVYDCKKSTDHFIGIYRIYPNVMKEIKRMSTCNWLDLQTLGSQPIMRKNLLDRWLWYLVLLA